MNFLETGENKLIKSFLKQGYLIKKTESKQSLNYIHNFIKEASCKILNTKQIDLNNVHKFVEKDNLNEFRLSIIKAMSRDRNIRFHYFNLAKKNLYILAGNELMMQKNINLSIQFPNDETSLLPIHSDVWSGDSAYEINLWLPLVNCYKTKSMYILKKNKLELFLKNLKKLNVKSSDEIFNIAKKNVNWLKINYGNFLLFNQAIPHGNVINKENETRWSMNCRFKSIFTPYEDKKIGEFFLPITTRAMTEIGLNYSNPFKK
tara:strand:- start:831 stop:1613 length:783 start_codon:yes stop_codon:yes gene_type:complete